MSVVVDLVVAIEEVVGCKLSYTILYKTMLDKTSALYDYTENKILTISLYCTTRLCQGGMVPPCTGVDSMWMLTMALFGSRLQGQECKRETASIALL